MSDPFFSTVDAASLLGEVSHLVPGLLGKQDVICLDSSGDEDEKADLNRPALAIRDGDKFTTVVGNSISHVYLKSSHPKCVYHIAVDVIELSSGDEDALQISSESADEDSVGGSEESSGAHINDALNLPDAQGQVLININHPAEENDIYLAPQLARAVKPHQVCKTLCLYFFHLFYVFFPFCVIFYWRVFVSFLLSFIPCLPLKSQPHF